MSFAGIVVWNAKYGVPHSYNEALDMQEQVAQAKSDEIDSAFIKLAEAVQSFTRQALQFYSDDVLNMYENFADNFEAEQYTYPIVDFDFIPSDLELIFLSVILKVARENNLVVRDDTTWTVYLPDGQSYQDEIDEMIADGEFDEEMLEEYSQDFVELCLEEWEMRIQALELEAKVPRISQTTEKLPDSYTDTIRLIDLYMSEKFAELNLTTNKIGVNNLAYCIETEQMQVVLSLNVNESWQEIKLSPSVWVYFNTWDTFDIKDKYQKVVYSFGEMNKMYLAYRHFFRFSQDETDPIVVTKKNELFQILDNSLLMLNYILPHCYNNLDMYNFLAKQMRDPHIKPHIFSGYYSYFSSAYTLLYLAFATQQPNLEQLKIEYSKLHIELRNNFNQVTQASNPNSRILSLTEAEAEQKFEVFAQHLQKLASENQLLHSVVRADLYGQFG